MSGGRSRTMLRVALTVLGFANIATSGLAIFLGDSATQDTTTSTISLTVVSTNNTDTDTTTLTGNTTSGTTTLTGNSTSGTTPESPATDKPTSTTEGDSAVAALTGSGSWLTAMSLLMTFFWMA
ncbi:hypothetical protein LSH36_192g04040 [Paralvinella palmiformis]|uniref:Uncharacterized protein n=1 Tax=Paralvinella palmiformis TaxID=53620 RepID=A0AAD9N7Y2_9ANNE|nr:hypothetical protein LSH36_192g04040 [Paralvinella palmiformis]